MPNYKVSYKVLRQQGEDMKAVAKLVDGYAERVAQVSGRLGEGDLLAQVRTNLGKLREQLGESRTVLNTAGEFLTKTVDSYTGVEVRQVKKADGTRAHNRDFYKNPVVVASAGGAAVGSAAAMTAPAVSTPAATTVNYTDNSVHVSYVAVDAAPTSAADVGAVTPVTTAAIPSTPAAATTEVGTGGAGMVAGAGVAGAAVGAGAVLGVKHLTDRDKQAKAAQQEKERQGAAQDGYDPEAELEKAIARVQALEDDAT
jgi:hypothetical protein